MAAGAELLIPLAGVLDPDTERTRLQKRMAAHARSVLTDTGLTVPVGGGRLLLGTWQGIFLWEHRTAPQRRRVVVTVLGG